MKRYRCCILSLVLLLPNAAEAVVATRLLQFQPPANGKKPPVDLLLSQALFGKIPSMNPKEESWCSIQSPPATNPLLCDAPPEDSPSTLPANSILLVPRGTCPFERKALHAQRLGAVGVLIYETLASHYVLNRTATSEPSVQDIIFPMDKYDYDCSYGERTIPSNDISLDDPLPYNPTQNDLILADPDASPPSCASQAFLLTGPSIDLSSYRACCAWDISMELSPDLTLNTSLTNETVTIPAAFLTRQQHAQLLLGTTSRGVKLVERWHPAWNPSAILIWMLGVSVAAWAAYSSAGEYHRQRRRLLRPRRERPRPVVAAQQQQPTFEDEVMELTMAHVAGFIMSASTSLLVLFYFKIYGIVKVFYAFGCSSAFAQVLVFPLTKRIPNGSSVVWRHIEVGDVTIRDVVSHVVAFSCGAVWLGLAFFAREPDQWLFFWVMQNVFGSCMCCVFLKMIRLNNLKVAALLLIVAFFYDIFFVFITPHLFHGKSVMITVATSGGPPTLGPLWCEKYPNDAGCQGGNPLPMLLAIPRLFDYRGGSSLLGLGDIVLPGLLLSFGARLDAAKEVLGLRRRRGSEGRGSTPPPEANPPGTASSCNCYFLPLVVAYAVGLAMANAAVYIMRMGQPALLYLVPCCLGTMAAIGARKRELQQLWDGPAWLDENQTTTNAVTGGHAPLPSSEEQEAITAPSASADEGISLT